MPGNWCAVKAEGYVPSYHVGECQFHSCSALSWNSPDSIPDFARCKRQIPANNPFQFVGHTNVALDGDYCQSNSNCHSSEFHTSKCIDSKCVVSTSVGDACDNHKYCPMDAFCGEDKTCQERKADFDKCDSDEQCSSGYSCIKQKSFGNFACKKFHSLPNGFEFSYADSDSVDVTSTTPVVSESIICESYSQVYLPKEGVYQCRPANKNVDQSLVKPGPDQDCSYATYVNEDPTKYNVAMFETTESLCGFNKDPSALCPLQLGDDYSMKLLKAYYEAVNELPSH